MVIFAGSLQEYICSPLPLHGLMAAKLRHAVRQDPPPQRRSLMHAPTCYSRGYNAAQSHVIITLFKVT